jgi:hypothetical protein
MMEINLEVELAGRSRILGESLEKLIRPLLETNSSPENSPSQSFKLFSRDFARQVLAFLDPQRDLSASQILVLENGTGILARLLAERDADIVAAAPTENTARLANLLNPYPSIIYRWFNPLPPVENFDLVLDSGILPYYPASLIRELLPFLATTCRRKMIVPFCLKSPWYQRRLSKRKNQASGGFPIAEECVFSRTEVAALIEKDCGMTLYATREALEGSILIKAIKTPYLHRS